MNKEKVSVIIPVYNVENYIHRCLNSVISQTYDNLEIILVDDGSTDDSGRICDEYKEKDGRVVVIHKENGGQATARNLALDIATGDYIAFVDSDDYIEEDMFYSMMNEFIYNDVDIVVCGYKEVDERRVIREEKAKDSGTFDGVAVARDILQDKFPRSYGWNKIFKRKLFNTIRFPANRIYEDLAILYRLFNEAGKVRIIAPSFYNYYIVRPGNTTSELSSAKASKSYFNLFQACFEQFQFVKSDNRYSDLAPSILDSMTKMGHNALVNTAGLGCEKYDIVVNDIRQKYAVLGMPEPRELDSKWFYLKNRLKFIVKYLVNKMR